MDSDLIQKFMFGGFSCQVAACVSHPVDTIKTRMQLDGELAKSSNHVKKYPNMFTGMRIIAQEEGIRGLYKGLTAAILREAIYSTLRMGFYEVFKELFSGHKDIQQSDYSYFSILLIKFTAGGLAGMLGSGIATPTDLVKVRFQAEGPGVKPRYKSTFRAFYDIYSKEGLQGLYRGVVPTTQRAVLLTATQLTSYDHFKHTLISNNIMQEGFPLHFVSSMFAGLMSAITTSAVDNVKTRLMNQKYKGELYSGSMDCLIKTIKAEGIRGLNKGFISQWMRIGPHSITTFIVFEQLRKFFNINPI
eukprot:TRINITY_DN6998_c0_g1_i1.p1 TRINITY_DN6998_c0_g1~~TRINITY_DN6998_c0_g1_i1.p1  ORF type:complete len:303 (-),score=87.01 TRINITY_DN6998_c0_g1_i1:121-1029(-)